MKLRCKTSPGATAANPNQIHIVMGISTGITSNITGSNLLTRQLFTRQLFTRQLFTRVLRALLLATGLSCVLNANMAMAKSLAEQASNVSISSLSASIIADSTPKGYEVICRYSETCAVAKPSLVAFGSYGQFSYKLLNGAFECSERAFNRNPLNPNATTCSVATQAQKQTAGAGDLVTAANLKPGKYALISRHSHKALTITEKNHIGQRPYEESAAQLFKVTSNEDGYFELLQTGQALTVAEWETNDGASVALDEPSDSWNQQWTIVDAKDKGYVVITSRFSGKSLDVVGLNTHNAAQVRLWTYWGGKNQQWKLVRVDE